MRHERDVIPSSPAQTFPELSALAVFATNKEMTLGDSTGSQSREDSVREICTESLAPVSWRDCKVLEVPPPSVGTREHGPDDSASVSRNKAEPWVMDQIAGDCGARIGVAQSEAFSPLPERHHLVIV